MMADEQTRRGGYLDALIARLRAIVDDGRPLEAERTLAETLGVKRHQVRRALEVLRANGDIVPPVPRRHAAVRPAGRPRYLAAGGGAPRDLVERTNPIEVIEMRLAIEPALARLAALRATPVEITAIETALAQVSAPGADRDGDIAFHRAIAAAAHSTLATAIMALISAVNNDQRLRVSLPADILARERDEHDAIMAAIVTRDPILAEQAMAEHLRAAERWLHRRRTN